MLTDLPANTEKLRVDYRSNLYALSESTLYKFTAPTKGEKTYTAAESFPLNDALVYGNNSAVQSFALSLESNTAYILYKGNFLAITDKLQLPTVHNIPVADADKTLFNDEETPFTVLKTNPNAVMVAFDIDSLNGATVFPTLSYKRSKDSITALKMGEVDVYNLIAVYNEKKAKYDTYLVYSSSCTEYKASGYKTTYSQEEQSVGFITSTAALYKLPYADVLFATSNVPRGESVTLLGEITKLDRPYYYVSYTDADGITKTGYLPQVYVTAKKGETTNEQISLGGTENHTDAYARLAYILSATAVICLLVDYLILRKPKEEDETDDEE